MTANKELLSRTECNILRGIAIIGIFLHNYCHWLNPIVKENEYQYFQKNVDWLGQVILAPDEKIVAHVISFFGHYGVPLFLFLSAYGLVMKYETKPLKQTALTVIQPSAWNFIEYHFLKLFKMMVVGFSAFIMIDAITPHSHEYKMIDVLSMLGLFGNVLPEPDKVIWPGPFWFFGLMLQLYIIYRLFLYRRGWKTVTLLIFLCWGVQALCPPESVELNRLRYNFIGGMLPFGMGLLYARFGSQIGRQWAAIIGILSTIAVAVFSLNYQMWFWVPVFVVITGVCAARCLSKLWGISYALNWVGSISAALFVCHPITRKIFIRFSRGEDIYTGLVMYIIASLCLAWFFQQLFRIIPSPKQKD